MYVKESEQDNAGDDKREKSHWEKWSNTKLLKNQVRSKTSDNNK